jgi:hypothetical protein
VSEQVSDTVRQKADFSEKNSPPKIFAQPFSLHPTGSINAKIKKIQR